MTYYDEILKTRDIKEPPFWRFNLTDKEFEELSETLKAGFLNNRYNLLYREACLLYAS